MTRSPRASKIYRIRKSRGEPATMPIALVRRRIENLMALNVTRQAIAHAAGIDIQTVHHILNRNTDHVRIEIAAKIWKVDHKPHPAQKLVSSLGARRRVRALNAIGWPTAELAARLGLSTNFVLNDSLRRPHLMYSRWAEIRDLYEELSGTPGPSQQSVTVAKRAKHPSPLAWDGRDIDHPHTQPDWAAMGIKLTDRPVCGNNHEYTKENTYRGSDGTRQCRKCRRAAKARQAARKKAAA
ncbi:hypothetical protein [Nocardia sp. NPDC049707]|uniref:hypothetical protein n=1 Tax=Nocardia sp. NPDC049707 TaxID=3154735 RepID=UPI00341A2DA6